MPSKNRPNHAPHVFLGLSGGVDSAVSAYLLKEQGYQVTCVYMKNWSRDLPGMHCPWAEDLADAKRVAVKLGLDFQVFDFEEAYKKQVVDYMIDAYRRGFTPNPDVMCNAKIKFKLFYDTARAKGADFIATGHYARTDGKHLLLARDSNKDQTYFLYRIKREILPQVIFPVGDLTKPDVKALASRIGLSVAKKPESMGVCFVGEANMRDFLSEFIATSPGEIVDFDSKKTLGYHAGALFYTLGQRHGLNLTTGLPYYVVQKDMAKNIVYVSRNLANKKLWSKTVRLEKIMLDHTQGLAGQTPAQSSEQSPSQSSAKASVQASKQNNSAQPTTPSFPLLARVRHRAPLVPARLEQEQVMFASPERSLAPGQSIVLYQAGVCLGGGIIAASNF